MMFRDELDSRQSLLEIVIEYIVDAKVCGKACRLSLVEPWFWYKVDAAEAGALIARLVKHHRSFGEKMLAPADL